MKGQYPISHSSRCPLQSSHFGAERKKFRYHFHQFFSSEAMPNRKKSSGFLLYVWPKFSPSLSDLYHRLHKQFLNQRERRVLISTQPFLLMATLKHALKRYA